MTTDDPKGAAAVLFDLDGTLVDTATHMANSLVEAAAAAGYELEPKWLSTHSGGPLRDWIASRFGLTDDQVEPLYRDYIARRYASVPSVAPVAGADRLLRRLYACGTQLAIVTTSLRDFALAIIEAKGWSSYFGVVVGQETAARTKPAADPALYAMRALGVNAASSVFVGDTEADICCAREAGIDLVVGLAGTRPAKALSAAGARYVCANLTEVESLLL